MASPTTTTTPLANGTFESGKLAPWRVTAGQASVQQRAGQDGTYGVALGPETTSLEQTVTVRPRSRYRLTAGLQCGSGAEEVRVGVLSNGGAVREVSSSLVSYQRAELMFATGDSEAEVTVFLRKPGSGVVSFADNLSLDFIGAADRADDGSMNAIVRPPVRTVKVDQEIPQQSDDRMRWLLDAKFGMFIHWGLYAGPGQGEWYQHSAKIPPQEYAKLAYPESGDEYFAATDYDPGHWAEVARAAGMHWMCLTARHHDGYSLFDNPHPNAFTSVQTHKRDFVREYVNAVRKAGLKVGLYFSPIDWRYPSYYDVAGTDCKPNVFGYTTSPDHKENARLWKAENYAAVRQLMSAYGRIDYVFWDGGWLAEQGTDADSAYFHEPGLHMSPDNPWPIPSEFVETDSSGKPLGIMGLVRKHQPQLLCNSRYGWIGDIADQEGSGAVTGPIRFDPILEKCMSIQWGAWGYDRGSVEHGHIMGRDTVIDYLGNCVVRNMVLLLNFGPDRFGRMPAPVESSLRQTGEWLARVREAIYETRGGPWQPVDGEYGFCFKGRTVYAHLFQKYAGDTFRTPAIGRLKPRRAYDVYTGRSLPITVAPDRTITIREIDRTSSPADTIVAIEFETDVLKYAAPPAAPTTAA